MKAPFLTKLFRIFFISFFTSVFIFGQSSGIEFLRPPGYQAYFKQIHAYSNLQTIDLTGRWQYLDKRNGSWTDIEIPSSWTGFAGKIVFRKNFRIDSSYADKQIRLVIIDFVQRCSIKLNGEFVTSVEGPRAELDLPAKLLQLSELNTLEIEVDNTLDALNTIPVKSGRIQPANYGGITGDVFLAAEKTPFLYCNGIETILSNDGRTGYITADADIIKSPIQEVQGFIVWRVIDNTGKQVLSKRTEIGDNDSLALNIEIANPKIWSPSSPVLYTIQGWFESVDHITSYREYKIGFRSFSAADDFNLNGSQIQILGVCYRNSHIYGRTFTSSDFVRDLQLIRLSGANAVLLPEQIHPYFLQLCDSTGLMVFQSTSITGVPNAVLNRGVFKDISRHKIIHLKEFNSFHPSIVSWIAGLDIEQSPELDFIIEDNLFGGNRPVFFGTSGKPKNVDFLKPLGMANNDIEIVYGAGPTLHDDSEFSQSIQLDNISRDLIWWRRADGIFISSLADWKTDRLTLFQDSEESEYLNLDGLLRQDRTEKLAYRALQSGWFMQHSSKLIPAPIKEPLAFPIAGFILVTIILLYIRSNHVFKVQLSRVFAHQHGFYQDIKNRRFIQLTQTVVIGLSSVWVLTLISAALSHRLRHSESFDYLIGHLFQKSNLAESLIRVSHSPELGIIYFFFVILFGLIVTSLVFKISSFFLPQKITLGQSFVFTFWCSASFLWLAPVTVFFYRGLSINILADIEIGLVIIFFVWVYFRLLNALRVGGSSSYFRAFIIFTFIHMLGFGLILLYFQYKCAIIQYFSYFVNAVL